MGKILSDIDVGERLLICGDMNGHVGAEVDGFEGVHGGYGFGRRNVDGEMLLEFADALDLAIVNAWFKKEVRKMITYETKACKTVIDFFLIRKRERKLVRDVKVVHEECIKQHKLLICVFGKREAGEVQGEIYEKMQGMEIEGGCNGRYLQTESAGKSCNVSR